MTTEHTRPTVTMKPDQRLSWSLDAKGDPWSGQSLKARYQLSGRFLSGASGDLYRAHDGETGADVTIKLLAGPESPSDEVLRGLRDELLASRAIARIRPNVAVVRDCDRTEEGQSFVVMEPLEGRSLASVLRQEGPLGVERALRLALQVAEGLQAAHSLVLVHGALGAEHVLVGAHDAVKIIGFEVARLATRGPKTDATAGSREPTVGFRPGPPGELSERADVKAVGALLIDMLTGGADGSRDRPAGRGTGAPVIEIPASVKALIAQLQSDDLAREGFDMGAAANALWVELHRTTEPTLTRVLRPARVVWHRTPWRAVTLGVLVGGGVTLAGWIAYGLIIGGFSLPTRSPGKPPSADTRVASPVVPAVGMPASGGSATEPPSASAPATTTPESSSTSTPSTSTPPASTTTPESSSTSTGSTSTPPASTRAVSAPPAPSAPASAPSASAPSASPATASPAATSPPSTSRTSASPAASPAATSAPATSPPSTSPASAPATPLASTSLPSTSPGSATASRSTPTSPATTSAVTRPSPAPSRNPVETPRTAAGAAAARRTVEGGASPSNRASGPSAVSSSPAAVTEPPVARSPAPSRPAVTAPAVPAPAPTPASARSVAPGAQSTPSSSRQEGRSEPDPAAIIDWLVNEYPRQQR